MICTICDKDKELKHFHKKHLNNDDLACKNCFARHVTEYECTECGTSKTGIYYTRMMITGCDALCCHSCKGKGRGHSSNYFKKPDGPTYNRQCLSCDKYFETDSKFIRSCKSCNKNNDNYCHEKWGV